MLFSCWPSVTWTARAFPRVHVRIGGPGRADERADAALLRVSRLRSVSPAHRELARVRDMLVPWGPRSSPPRGAVLRGVVPAADGGTDYDFPGRGKRRAITDGAGVESSRPFTSTCRCLQRCLSLGRAAHRRCREWLTDRLAAGTDPEIQQPFRHPDTSLAVGAHDRRVLLAVEQAGSGTIFRSSGRRGAGRVLISGPGMKTPRAGGGGARQRGRPRGGCSRPLARRSFISSRRRDHVRARWSNVRWCIQGWPAACSRCCSAPPDGPLLTADDCMG